MKVMRIIMQSEGSCQLKNLKSRPIVTFGSSSKNHSSFQNESARNKPSFLNAWYELQWFLNSRIALSQTFDAAIKQIYALSVWLLTCLALLILSAQLAGLIFLLSSATTHPFPVGFHFMFGSFTFILVTAFKVMY